MSILNEPLDVFSEKAAPAEPRHSTAFAELRRRALSASAWTVGSMVANRGIRLVTNLVLTRLLFPEAFGLMAVVNVYLQGVQLLSDLGVGPSIIQNERGDEPKFLDTAWTIQIVRGILIWLGLALIAEPLAVFYAQPQLKWLIIITGFSAVLAGLESTAQFTLRKHLRPAPLATMEIGCQILGVLGIVAWAMADRSVWALAGGGLTAAVSRTLWTHVLPTHHRNRLRWDAESARSALHFGKWIIVCSAIGFFSGQLDRLMLPKYVPFDLVGVYSIAVMLATFPEQFISGLSMEVLFPLFAKLNQLPRTALLDKIRPVRIKVLALLAVSCGLLAGLGDVVVAHLYDHRYHAAGWMLCVLAIGLWPRLVVNTISPVLLGIGKPAYLAYSGAGRTLLIAVGMPLGYALGGLPGVVMAVALSSVADYVCEAYGLWLNDLWLPGQDLAATGLWAVVLAAVYVLRLAFGGALPGW
jgi:O-antigen/teichoic acid export membrane protein